jgi:hypothetical protein
MLERKKEQTCSLIFETETCLGEPDVLNPGIVGTKTMMGITPCEMTPQSPHPDHCFASPADLSHYLKQECFRILV